MCIKINIKKFLKRIFPCLYHKPKPEPQPEPTPPVVPEPIIEEPKPPWFGCSIYEACQQTPEKIRTFLQKLKDAGGNATEIFLIHSHDDNTYQPYPFNFHSGKFDLDEWNGAFWGKFQYFLASCKELGIVPFIRIHDFCSIKRKEISKFYCFMNNVQEFTSVYDKGLCPYYSKLNKRIIEELMAMGVKKFFFIPMSECDGSVKEVYDFNAWYVNNLFGYVNNLLARIVPQDQIIISADLKHFDKLKKLECRLEVHGIADVEDLVTAIQLYGNNIFGNGDGCNGNGIQSYNGYGEPSIDQAIELGKYIRNNNLFGYCYKLRSAYKTKGEVHIELADFSALKALAGEIK